MTAVWATPSGQFLNHGIPNWVDLYTEDAATSQSFYSAVLGWRFRNRFSLNPVLGDNAEEALETRSTVLVMCGGRPSAEIIERSELFADMLVPSRWYPHLYTTDMLTTLRAVQRAGGCVVRGPHDRGTMATVATILDPTGAMLCLWQPKDQPGNTVGNNNGALAWMELKTNDVDAARRFYEQVFHWRPSVEPPTISTATVSVHHTSFSTAIGPIAGAIRSADDAMAYWSPSFAVPDLKAATTSALSHGALAVKPPYDLAIGRQCTIVDPEGAEFSLLGPRRVIGAIRQQGRFGKTG